MWLKAAEDGAIAWREKYWKVRTPHKTLVASKSSAGRLYTLHPAATHACSNETLGNLQHVVLYEGVTFAAC